MDDQAQGGSDRAKETEDTARAPYKSPALKVYGTIAALTRAVGRTGTVADGGHGNRSKTS